MGLRASVVVCVTSFLLGSLFTHWIADSLTLWKAPVTDQNLWIAASYYAVLAKSPIELQTFLGAVVVLGGTTIVWSLRDGEAGNLMFDGGSIFLFLMSVGMYVSSVIPNLFAKFASLPTHQLTDAFPRELRATTIDLASSNLICSVALTGVLALQAGRHWAEGADDDEEEEAQAELVGRESRRDSREATPAPSG